MNPWGKELTFMAKLVAVIAGASLLSFGILYLTLDTWVGADYGTAFQIMSAAYQRMDYYIALAVLAQLVISCLVVFFLALHYSHKIAGPMYRLKTAIQSYARGDAVARVAFRSTDFLHEVAEQFTAFFTALERNKKIFAETRRLIEGADLLDETAKEELLHLVAMNLRRLQQAPADDETPAAQGAQALSSEGT